MKNLMIAVVAVAMLAFAGNVFAGDISQDMLADMGLGEMQSMSDDQGMDVRGMGYYYSPATAKVSGFVTVNVGGVFIFEKKYASDYGRTAYAEGGFSVQITSFDGYNFSSLSVVESGYAFSGSRR
jgi:hypothetical protein